MCSMVQGYIFAVFSIFKDNRKIHSKIIYKSTAEGTHFLLWRKAEIISFVHFSIIVYCFVSLFRKEKGRNVLFSPNAETELRNIWSRDHYEIKLNKIYVKNLSSYLYLPQSVIYLSVSYPSIIFYLYIYNYVPIK